MVINSENWVGENTATVGTGDVSLGGAVNGFVSFANMPAGKVHYIIVDGSNREAGIGDYSVGKIKRTTIIATLINGVYTKSGSPITLSGNAQIYHGLNSDWARIINEISTASTNAVDIANGAAQTATAAANNIAALDTRVQGAEATANEAKSTATEAKETADGVDAKAQEALDKVNEVVTTGAVLLNGSLPMSGPLTIQAPGLTPKLNLKMTEVGANIIRFTDNVGANVDFGVASDGKFIFARGSAPVINGFFYTTDNKPTLADLGGGNITASIEVQGTIGSTGSTVYGASNVSLVSRVGTKNADTIDLIRDANGDVGLYHRKADGSADNWLIQGVVNAARAITNIKFFAKITAAAEYVAAAMKGAIQLRSGAGIDFQGPSNGNLYNIFAGVTGNNSNTLVITTGTGNDETQHSVLLQLTNAGNAAVKGNIQSRAGDGTEDKAIGFASDVALPYGGTWVGGLHNYAASMAIDYYGKQLLTFDRNGYVEVGSPGRFSINGGAGDLGMLRLVAKNNTKAAHIYIDLNGTVAFSRANNAWSDIQSLGMFTPYPGENKSKFVTYGGHTRGWTDSQYVANYVADTPCADGSLVASFGAGLQVTGNYWMQQYLGSLMSSNSENTSHVLAYTDGGTYVRAWKFFNSGLLRSPQELPQQWYITADGNLWGTAFGSSNSPGAMVTWCNNTFAPKSDIKFKENIQPCTESALAVVDQLHFKSFDWKETGEHEDFGLIAQELEQTRPSLVSHVKVMKYDEESDKNIVDEENSFLAYDTAANLSLALKSIQELNAIVKGLQQEINTLKGVQ